ncbi:fibronectin type III domain-containing protein [Nocardioides sp. J54]|uniref:fibronectin type III domain-containing protein n=1 Tax=Nocardioides sp. J54 TaxID=935866 RepID=UPI0004B4CF72|nr:fibronectin type III domain-containing protein [Nocardioides sp. J54]
MRLFCRALAAVLLATMLVHTTAPAEAASRPSAPRWVAAVPMDKAVRITWHAPASEGRSRIDAYAVQRRNTTSSPWVTVKYTGPRARAWTEPRLVNGARVFYRVVARNGSGLGRPSRAVAAVPRTVPSAPRVPEADAYVGALGVYWAAPASNGGARIDQYRVQWSLDGATWIGTASTGAAPTAAAPLTLPLAPGTRYWLRVRAHNAAGFGPATGFGPYTVRTAPEPDPEPEP